MAQSERQRRYSKAKKREVLELLEANAGNLTQTARETGVSRDTVRAWRRARERMDRMRELARYSRDAWERVHMASAVVKASVEELGGKEAAAIAAGYFDRQMKAEERLVSEAGGGEEYAVEWGE